MSRAFTKEVDDGPPPPPPTPLGALPAGTPNLVTPDGLARLHAKVKALVEAGDTAAANALATRLERAQVVTPDPDPSDLRVRFGDRVEVLVTALRDGAEQTRRFRIVGVDEVDLRDASHDPGAHEPLSWLAPLAKGLLGAELGDVFTTTLGRDAVEVELVALLPPLSA